MNAEWNRLAEAASKTAHWRRWGAYLSERQWGTVREDYSRYGTAWDYFPFEVAHLRAYRWGEDGLLGFCDNKCRLCFSIGLWNGRDPILKERLYGLAGPLGSHGEDVKEIYYYLDAAPTGSYLKGLYKYPQEDFPYALLREKGRLPRWRPEFELMDSGAFDGNRYFDVGIEYCKADPNDILIRITVDNRGPVAAPLHLLGQIYFRNLWSFGRAPKPAMKRIGERIIAAHHQSLGNYEFLAPQASELVFTENESNPVELYGFQGTRGFYKDGIGDFIVEGRRDRVNPAELGTKAAAVHYAMVEPGGRFVATMRLREQLIDPMDHAGFDETFALRIAECDEFYHDVLSRGGTRNSEDAKKVQRQAAAGLIWTKQYYNLSIDEWIKGDPGQPEPPEGRDRNASWRHLFNEDIISMPDKWEYPWYAAWDSAFHMVPFALIDPDFAKKQLGLFLREWYMHPNGQIPAYEWAFSDVNPPVHAWACWRVYKIDAKLTGKKDTRFLESVFHKLLMNFTWWVNRKDATGNNIFEGGFLGLDNIGIFDRSKPLPMGGHIEQSDGTSWMAMYCLNLLKIAIELAKTNPVYEDIASKFFEHFLFIASAMNGSSGTGLWDEEDQFYYDRLRLPNGEVYPMRVRSLVGLIPLFAVDTLDWATVESLPGFRRRMEWFIENRPDLAGNLASLTREGVADRRLLSLVGRERLRGLLRRMLDPNEFLSDYGIRGLSKAHSGDNAYRLNIYGTEYSVGYEPGESQTGLFGGNSNWRGPIWFPVNYLLIESLQKFHHYHGEAIQVECPVGSGKTVTLDKAAQEISRRLSSLFLAGPDGRRPAMGHDEKYWKDPHFKDHILFHEYFHGDSGLGLGAKHQTGWTALVAKLMQTIDC
jgi:hypothetical protein